MSREKVIRALHCIQSREVTTMTTLTEKQQKAWTRQHTILCRHN